jgi:hypothetical protein
MIKIEKGRKNLYVTFPIDGVSWTRARPIDDAARSAQHLSRSHRISYNLARIG